jgi:hypothetical protein
MHLRLLTLGCLNNILVQTSFAVFLALDIAILRIKWNTKKEQYSILETSTTSVLNYLSPVIFKIN